MKLTKKLETEILKSYNTYWDSYFKGDMKTFAKLLDDNCHIIGSTEFDVFRNKKSAVKFYTSTADQITGKVDFRNRKINVIPSGKNIMVEEFCDFYFLANDEWKFYGHCRLSTLFSKKENDWKIIYQHGSLPDSKAQEGEQIAAKEISQENKKLRNSLKRGTAELESKNRELEIEAALERVRATTMAMQKQDDLLMVLDILVEQLLKLGVNLQVANFSNGLPGDDWDLWIEVVADANNIFNNYVHFPRIDHPYFHRVEKNIETYKKDGTDLFKDVFSKEEKDSWQEYVNTHTIYKDLSSKEIRQSLYEKPGYNWSMVILKDTWVSICRFDTIPFSAEEDALLRRFANSFGQTYTRFLDLQKAEAQAREAQIELALERIRARTMAMQRSNELPETSFLLFQQLKELGDTAVQLSIGIIKEETGFVELSATVHGNTMPQTYSIPADEPFMMKKAVKAWKEKKKSLIIELRGKELKDYNEWRNRPLKKKIVFPEKQWIINLVFFSKGMLSFSSNKEISKKTFQLLERFAGVFDGTYTRFLDLQKAEAQAKESQIQLALERVRARTMAMQKSSELQDAAILLFDQIKSLDIPTGSCGFNIWNNNESATVWVSSPEGGMQAPFEMPHTESPIYKKVLTSKKKGEQLLISEVGGEELKKHFDYLITVPGIGDRIKKLRAANYHFPEKIIYYFAFFNQGYLSFHVHELHPEAGNVFVRFAKVFEQTYTRFLDLQKAEAQAKEAKIEAALERIRSRSLAMHNSSELSMVVDTLLQEFTKLEFTLTFCIINLINEEDKSNTVWAANPETGKDAESYYMKFEDYDFHRAMWNAWKAQDKRFLYTLKGEEKKIYDEYLYSQTEFRRFPKHVQEANKALERYVAGFTFFKYSGLQTVSVNEITEADLKILERFGKVFEQSYTRFLDLQNAEAQARESQIQLALERVRARTMAMQKSEELNELVKVVYDQLDNLNIKIGLGEERGITLITFIEKTKELNFWIALQNVSQAVSTVVPYTDHPIISDIWKARERGVEYFSKVYGFEEKNRYWLWAFEYTNNKDLPEKIKKILWESECYASSIAFAKFSALYVPNAFGLVPLEKDKEILIRFAKVFDQAYTRFLDLQKAEAQTKEAKIEASLEKVRSRSLGMHRSDELNDVVMVLFEKLKDLQIPVTAVGITTYTEGSKDMNMYVCGDIGNGLVINNYLLPYFNNPITNDLYDVREKGLDFFVGNYSKEEKNSFYEYSFEHSELKVLPDEIKSVIMQSASYSIAMAPAKHSMINLNDFEGKPLSENEKDVLKRFSKVFDQVYIRFLDLQKAEAQAREAQIQLALERVRARTMAMHQSEELAETAQVLFHQLIELGDTPDRISIGLVDETTEIVNFWTTDQSGSRIDKSFTATLNERTVIAKAYKAWKSHESSLITRLEGDELKEWMQFAREKMGIIVNDDLIKNRRVHHHAFFSHGWILVTTHEPQSAEAVQILERFASVFNLTYRRFLDLQKAEAQAREATIEAALERVRSKTMAMHNSQDVAESVSTLFDEVTKLGIATIRCGIGIMYDAGQMELWTAKSNGKGKTDLVIGHMDMTMHPLLQGGYDGWKNKEKFYSYELKGDDLINYYTIINNHPDYPVKYELSSLPAAMIHSEFYFPEGTLYSFSLEELSAESKKIFNRFAGVFGQTYRRYLDLQKAEAQAREAQIEASLERVRASAMAMHHSDELSQVLSILFDQFDVLGISPVDAHLDLFDWEKNTFIYRATGKRGARVIAEQTVDLDSRPEWQALAAKWKNSQPNSIDLSFYPKEVIRELMGFFPDIWAAMPEEAIMDPEEFPDGMFDTLGYHKFGYLGFHHHRESTAEEKTVLIRFANEFERLYQRFLDLQKAEAQTRESQIQLALERVRARTMAMQKSDELAEAASLLFEQVKSLGIESYSSGFTIWENKDTELVSWMCNADGSINPPFRMPAAEIEWHRQEFKSWKKKEDYVIHDFTGNEMQAHYAYLRSFPLLDEAFKISETAGVSTPARQVHNAFNFAQGNLLFITLKPVPEEYDIFKRFAKVFEQTYTRFLDLRQAEAQARESQIQLALERVRARTMAMQKSEELKEVIQLVYGQFIHLNINIEHTGFLIEYKERDDLHIWLADEHLVPSEVTIPWFDSIPNNSIKEAKEKGQDFFKYDLSFEEKNDFYRELFKFIPGVPQETLKYYLNCPGLAGSGVLLENIGLYIENFSGTPYSDDENKILMRFGKVFQQTYTRFLDLQKAEAQAREAKIQLALERARAQSMMMQHSTELDDTLRVFHEQVLQLNIPSAFSFLWLPDEEKDKHIFWAAWAEKNSFKSKAINYPLDRNEPATAQCLIDWKSKECVVSYHVPPGGVENYFAAWSELIDGVEQLKPEYFSDGLYYVEAFMKYGCFGVMVANALSENEKKILERFATEFERAYTRFLDLQKAEAQARESQIQLALERVRARTMAMQKSDELSDAVYILFQQFNELGENPDQATIGIINEDEKVIDYWVTMHGNPINKVFKFSLDEPNVTNKIYHAWKENKKSLVIDLTGDSLIEFMQYRAGKGGAAVNAEEKRRIINVAFFSKGLLNVQSNEERSEESIKLLERFASVFEQTYTRFLDLQNAEAQAREAKIETALEKVRSRTMAMFKSDELADAAATVFHQLQMLGIHNLRRSLVGIMNEEEGVWDVWYTTVEGESFAKFLKMPVDGHPIASEMKVRWLERKMIHVELAGDKLITWIKFIIASGWQYPKGEKPPDKFVIYGLPFSNGYLVAFTNDNILPSEIELLQRFARVFDQTYTRFLDLQKAEAQARESQIQLALERVRARTMAMQRSEELSETSFVLFQQFAELGIVPNRFFIGIVNEDERNFDIWLTEWGGKLSSQNFKVNIEEPVLLKKVYEAWKRKDKSIVVDIHDEDIVNWNQYLEGVGLSVKNRKLVSRLVNTCANFSKGFIAITTPEITTDETVKLLERFASVFDGTYTRFLDLKNAEAQAREATIVAGLERVRGKAMAMHTSRDLAETIKVFYHEMEMLSVTPRRCGVGLLNRKTRIVELSTMNTTEEGNSIEIIGRINMIGHPVLEGIYDNWLQQKEYQPVLRGNEIKDYYKLLRPQISYPDYPNDAIQFGYFFYFPEGGVYAWTNKEMGDDELKIYRRFTSVLSLTYKRYKDLMDSEARAKEAIKQASLDRVRGEIASMRSTEDLQRITPLIFKELTALGVPFFRCGVFIINESENIVHAYLSAPDGHSLAVLNLPFDSNELTSNSVQYWRKGMVYHQHWNKEEFVVWTQSMMEQGQIQKRETYQGASVPPESLDLHFVPFTQGMLYVGNTKPLAEDEIDLVKSLAEAFSIAYARYEDFTKLEHAKQSVENTLTELKAAQKQLIQSEKMASLGELTAGIAHEIQNPLNFVNNFSELSNELIEEMNEELIKGDIEEAKAIAADVKQNLIKINHHGKRAGDIVKGMLQHSQKSTGVKEPTDINALADEYLRLSYHGLRAKDKSFNATMKTDFDKSIGKINIIPQDIGRVLLNLYNNAFYAVRERQEARGKEYEPTISVTTKKSENQVIITVSDNGSGIPQKIVDKIFQPFFTTKPTGQGTGLGLSLSYDIVKAHGGGIKVHTNEGEAGPDDPIGQGSEFIIHLQIK